MIKVDNHIMNSIVEHANRDKPVEACGYLAGKENTVTDIYKMTNADNSPEHYSFVPEEQFKIIKETRSKGLDILAVYHSHPLTPARMSEEDLRLAYDRSLVYVIVSLAGKEPVIKAFSVADNESIEVTILPIGDTNHE
ncbi:MAG: M67 family metallopeptidase [bacterium]|nr:M67 family metallopeptidase [bacterium]